MLSICIPAYTYVRYTGAAVQSILGQDTDVELVVVEDFDLLPENHPEKADVDAVRALLSGDKRVRWVRSGEQRAIQKNWNHTVSLASRKYVKVMGADDRLRPASIVAMEKVLKEAGDVQFIGHLGVVINGQGEVVRRMMPYVKDRAALRIAPHDALRLKLCQVARFREPACNIFTRDIWERVGGYGDSYRFCFDVHFNARVMASVPSLLVSEEWIELRRHEGSDGAKLPAELALCDLQGFVAEILALLPGGASKDDVHAGTALVSYRVIELAFARANGSIVTALDFIWTHRKFLGIQPLVLARVLGTLYRRIRYGDVQNTLQHAQELEKVIQNR